jgi:riboflavin biosynthesis pyrimidine reductase
LDPIRTLFDAQSPPQTPSLTDGLRTMYHGDLRFPESPADRPYVIANFVTSLDGVVSFNIPGQSVGAQISGSNEADQFIMGLLRASADAVIVGTGTFEAAGHDTLWFPESTYAPAANKYRQYRLDILKKAESPLLVIVSGHGELDLTFKVFRTAGQRVLIVTTERGRGVLREKGSERLGSVEVKVLSPADHVSPADTLRFLKQEYNVGLALCEGGPTLFGQLLAARLIDELFLTLAPQLAGRGPEHPRVSLVEDVEFSPENSRWSQMLSLRKAGSLLYLRYGMNRKS